MSINNEMSSKITSQDQVLSEMERTILQAITVYNRPVTAQEIAYELNISLHTVNSLFRKLVEKGNLVKYSTSNNRSTYYAVANSKEAIDQALSQKYVDMIAPLEKKFDEIKEAQEKLDVQLQGVYAQIITLMGIFVAVFALVIVNVNAIGEFTRSITDICELCKALAILNIPLVISLAALMLFIKLFIKPPKKKD